MDAAPGSPSETLLPVSDQPARLPATGRDLRWNFFWGIMDGSFFGIYLVLADVNLVIPWLLSQLTTARAIVGLAPTLTIVGSSLPQLLVARLVQRDPYRRHYVVRFAIVRFTALSLMLPFLFWDLASPIVTLAVILVAYSLASLAVGFIALPWQEMTARVIPSRRLSSFFGLRSFVGGLLGLGAAIFIRSYLGATPTVPLPKFGLLFALGIGCLALATFSCGMCREPPGPAVAERSAIVTQFRQAAVLCWHHRAYRHYLLLRALLMIPGLTAPLYIVEGRTRYGLLAESIGTYTMAGLVAGIVASLGWSFLGDRLGLSRLCGVVGLLSIVPPLLAVGMPLLATTPLGASGGWFAVFLVLGAATTGQMNVSFRGVIELPPPESRGLMIGMGNTFSGLVSLVGPVIGLLADAAGVSAAFGLAALASALVIPLARRLGVACNAHVDTVQVV
ncbi:MAG: hypothetical protein HYY04_11180 [Chloroflexi bacterium]|nr:hypothetical protein [Chloroflexota bacterium]